MNEKFFPELTRRLRQEGIATGPVKENSLPILVDGHVAMTASGRGTIFLMANAADSPEAHEVYDAAAQIGAQVHEYVSAMEAAPLLNADGLHEGFHLLAEYNGVVLAGQELGQDWGYKFVTWRRSPDRKAVNGGEYFDGGHFYEAAKLDFACRAGLVDGHRQFTDEQLVELYRCACETLESGYPLTKERREVLEQAAEQIEGSVDDLDHRVSLSNQRELEAADQQADRGPEMGMSP